MSKASPFLKILILLFQAVKKLLLLEDLVVGMFQLNAMYIISKNKNKTLISNIYFLVKRH